MTFVNYVNERKVRDTLFTQLLFYLATRKQELDEALVTMSLKDTQPFSVVEDVGFRDFVHKLDPTYVLPTRQVCIGACIRQKSIIILHLTIKHCFFFPLGCKGNFVFGFGVNLDSLTRSLCTSQATNCGVIWMTV